MSGLLGTVTCSGAILLVLDCGRATTARIVAHGAGASERCPLAGQERTGRGGKQVTVPLSPPWLSRYLREPMRRGRTHPLDPRGTAGPACPMKPARAIRRMVGDYAGS